MPDEFPVLQVDAGVEGDSGEGVEGGGGAEEGLGVDAVGDEDAGGVGVEAGEDGVVDC